MIDDGANRIDLTQDFSFSLAAPGGSIGDTIWGDLDGSGGDQGTRGLEPGLAGVAVTLCVAGPDQVLGTPDDVIVATTLSDSNGTYQFAGLPFGSYRVKVDSGSLPAGYAPAPSYDPDGGADGFSDTSVTPGAPHVSDQDFSYPPDGSGTLLNSLGDKIWADNGSADATQAIDGSEPGIPGVLVELLDGAGTSVLGTAFTDERGCYLFTALPDATYIVRVTSPAGYASSPSYDPFGANDGSSVIALSGGQHDRLQDFSYAPATPLGSIGDTIWFDTDSSGGDQTTQGAEPGLAGVVVYLCDNFGTELGSTATDGSGNYLFEALPYGDYFVKIDTATLPAGVSVTNTHDSDGGGDSLAAVTLDGGNPDDRAQDFSYPPCGQIGDTVFYDADGNGVPGFGEGLAGITVQLLDATGTTLLATDFTDAQGRYLFACVEPGTYVVRVLLGTVENTVDPDGPAPGNGESILSLGVGESDFDQDFGYRAPLAGSGSLGNLIWEDRNADGTRDPGESGIDGVTVDLYYDINGNCVLDTGDQMLGRTTTSGGGAYLFDRLLFDNGGGADMDYLVDVSDVNGVLGGQWHSLGAQGAGDDGESKADPYCVTLSAATPDVLSVDFGYYVDAACLGNYVWQDLDDNGIQDDGAASGIDGVLVTLTITYPDNTQVEVAVRTASVPNPGAYNFCNLLMDEDYRVASGTLATPAPGQPAFGIRVDTLDRFTGQVDAPTATDLTDSDQHTGVAAMTIQGSTDASQNANASLESDPVATYDFGFANKPDSFAEFQMGYATVLGIDDNDVPGVPGGGTNTANDQGDPGDNPDGDLYSNALEYALCDPPGSGANPKPFCVELGGTSGTVDAVFFRAEPAPADLTYTLEVAAGIGSPWGASTTLPGVTDLGNGSAQVTYADLEAEVGAIGIARLRIDLAGDLSGPHYTPVFGWSTLSSQAECETCSNPYAPKEVFSGTIDGVSGSGNELLDLATSAGAGSIVAQMAARPHYIEVLSGTYAGHRFDVASATATSITLDTAATHNTLAPIPDLGVSQITLRPHTVLDEVVSAAAFVDSVTPANNDDPATAGRLLFFDQISGWSTYFAYDDSGGITPQWTSADNSFLENVGDAVLASGNDQIVVIYPCAGFFTHCKAQATDLLMVGVVRTWDFACPLEAGYNFVGSGYPTAQSPDSRDMSLSYFSGSPDPSTSDQVEFWVADDATFGVIAYDSHFRVQSGSYDYWTTQEDSSLPDEGADPLFKIQRASFINSLNGNDKSLPASVWLWPAPWSP